MSKSAAEHAALRRRFGVEIASAFSLAFPLPRWSRGGLHRALWGRAYAKHPALKGAGCTSQQAGNGQDKRSKVMKLHYPHNHCVSRDTLDAIRRRHPLALQAEQYAPGKWQIGHGCRGGIYPGLKISPIVAEDLLRNDVLYVESRIRAYFDMPLSDSLYQVLVSHLFDIGTQSTACDDIVNLVATNQVARFKQMLPGSFGLSRFGADVGRTARFWEAKTLVVA